jgi:hypothetical protein
MISLKRKCPSLNNDTIVIDSDSEDPYAKISNKKVKPSAGTKTTSNNYDSIP